MDAPYLGIDHLGVVVSNLDTATATYRDTLGFPIVGGEVLVDDRPDEIERRRRRGRRRIFRMCHVRFFSFYR